MIASGRLGLSQGVRGVSAGGVILPAASTPAGAPVGAFYQTFLQVDPTHIYWWTRGTETVFGFPFTVGRANLDGSHKQRDLVPTNINDFLTTFVIDETYIYIPIESNLGRAKLDGSEWVNNWLKFGAGGEIEWMAHSGEYIYIVRKEGGGLPGPIGRFKADGTGYVENWGGASSVKGMCADGAYLYVAGEFPRARSIDRLLIKEPVREVLVPAVEGWKNIGAVAVNSSHVYWLAAEGFGGAAPMFVARARLDGTEVERTWQSISGEREIGGTTPLLNGLAADDGYVYWVENKATGYSFIARRNLATGLVEHEWISGAAVPGGVTKVPGTIAAGAPGVGLVGV